MNAANKTTTATCDADQAFQTAAAATAAKLALLQKALKSFSKKQAASDRTKRDWSFAGSLNKTNADLDEILAFLGGANE